MRATLLHDAVVSTGRWVAEVVEEMLVAATGIRTLLESGPELAR
jgi:hypothetical protein